MVSDDSSRNLLGDTFVDDVSNTLLVFDLEGLLRASLGIGDVELRKAVRKDQAKAVPPRTFMPPNEKRNFVSASFTQTFVTLKISTHKHRGISPHR